MEAADLLQITSCLFATVVVHAYWLQCALYHHTFLAVTVFSVWFHSTHNTYVAFADKVLAHVAFLLVLCETPQAVLAEKAYLIGFPALVAVIWASEFVYTDRRFEIHVYLHLLSVVGLHCFLVELH
jgi:hypothetical protein